ncbi:cbb3-type cytochrome c oxidase subunit I [Pusillimonas sp. ANT_WB101]|uniref:cbb3-type cytochrome c oxidase subunit I n=1 Tax=Pusillimonas sp. ANT_WB101 TaxID=2597356 RepID=UPI0011F03C83|nr:cbb3-type cytochrome c oxidase subunit I [Pusillimonas sp. ANT_WB101]KAA0911588.1 cytochrome C oxidase subunit I [Pusillimonas sp. ANT_WB101]
MSTLTLYPENEQLPRGERIVFNLYMVTALVLFVLMMLLGLTMRSMQAQWLGDQPVLFYQILTMHGAGMVGTMSLGTLAVMWFFLRKYVRLHVWAFTANYVLFMLGALAIIAAVFAGGYAGAWTFLYPLPVKSMGIWSIHAAALFMVGYLLIGVGMLLFYMDAAAAIIRTYGNLGKGLGLQWLFRGEINPDHPKAVVAGTMVIIANSLGILAGAVVLVMSLVNAYFPEMALNALLAKNLIYWFGHMVINATIYMGVIAVYELLGRYSGKPYKITRPFLWSWAVSTVFVIVVFPHHLLMDYAQPRWLAVMGQVVSFGAGFPVFLVTAYGVLTNIYRSNIQWQMPSRLMVLAVFGWAAGIVPAIIDGTISVNLVMHNTQWVPGHFHFYLLLGVLPMILALLFHVIGNRAHKVNDEGMDKVSLTVYALGAMAFALAFLNAGHMSVPRRFATHIAQWVPNDQFGAIAALFVILAMLWFAGRIIFGLLRAPGDGYPGSSSDAGSTKRADVGAPHATG